MADYLTTDTELASVASAIRSKGGTSSPLVYPTEFISAINAIEIGVDTSDANATASDMLSGKTAYVNGSRITGNIPSKSSSNLTASGATVTAPAGYYPTAATKTIDSGSTTQNAPTINSSTGLVTATATVTAGYQAADTKSNTLQLTTQAAQTITPGTTNQTIAAGKYLTGTQTIAGDSNLVAENIAEGVSIFGVTGTHSGPADFIENYNTWTSYENLSANRIADGTFCYCSKLTTISFPACILIGDHAFAYCSSLTTASFPACTTIDYNAFAYCSKLSTISFPVCTNIRASAFINCIKLTTANFLKCTNIDDYAFAHCSSLTTASFPACTNINNYAFSYCFKLTTISFPVCRSIGISAFINCSSLTTASFPACTTIDYNAFAYCSKLSTISFPACTNIYDNAFAYCSSLTTASFPACTNIYGNAFMRCYNLTALYLTGSSYVSLSNSNAFYSTPIGGYSASAGKYGSIYVPASMLASYKTKTNWTYFSSRFVGV